MSGASLMGLAVGVAAGLAAGLLAAPMRGSEMRSTLRSRASDGSARLQSMASSGREWAQQAMDRAMCLIEEGRRALRTSYGSSAAPEPAPLTATLGEIAQQHGPSEGTL
jgi:gas vesicle protein